MSTENLDADELEQFYSDLAIALREDLLKVSGLTRQPRKRRNVEKQAQMDSTPPQHGRWIPFSPRSPELRAKAQMQPGFQPSYAGFQLIDIVRLKNIILIGFSWPDAGEQIFVYTVDLYPFAVQQHGVHTSTVIISTLLLEQLGENWYHHRSLKTVNGLTFLA